MSFTFPALKNCAPVKFPLSRTVSFMTKVTRFLDDTEQRFVKRYRQDVFAIMLTGLDHEDCDKVEAFWEDVRGPLAPWSIAVREVEIYTELIERTVTYDGINFVGDTLTWTEDELPERWSISLPARQTMWLSDTPAGDPGGFPHFVDSYGQPRRFQRPISMSNHMRTVMIDHPDSGLRWATAMRNTPAGPRSRAGLHSWKFKAQVQIPEIWALEEHFVKCRGRHRKFGFDAPDGFFYPSCRYGMDTLEIVYAGPNDVTADVSIEEIR